MLVPIIASTATTLAAFVPLALWPGIIGEFMQYLPITLMIVLSSSLFVALVITPVLLAVLMKVENQKNPIVQLLKPIGAFLIIGILFLAVGFNAIGNFCIIISALILINGTLLSPATKWFQNRFLPKIEIVYQSFLKWVLYRRRPLWVISGTFLTLIISFILTGIFPPKVLFFPENQPNYINVFIELPVGTNIAETNKATIAIKLKIDSALNTPIDEKDSTTYLEVADEEYINGKLTKVPFVESIIEQVGKGTSDPNSGPSFGETPNKSRITISFVNFRTEKASILVR